MRRHKDPVTGDSLTSAEYISWKIQGIIRRWAFLLVFLAVTALCWLTRNDTVLLWWNLVASLLAIVIEFIVGLAMFGQTRRDAVALRETRAMAQQNKALEEQLNILLEHVSALVEVDHAEHGRLLRELHQHTQCIGHAIILKHGEQEEVA